MSKIKITGEFAKDKLQQLKRDIPSADARPGATGVTKPVTIGTVDQRLVDIAQPKVLQTAVSTIRTKLDKIGVESKPIIDAVIASSGAQYLTPGMASGMRDSRYRATPTTSAMGFEAAYAPEDSASVNAAGLGVVLMRRPTAAELEMGARPDDYVIGTYGTMDSPFGRTIPVGRTLGGRRDPGSEVTERVGGDDSLPLYGDLASLVDRASVGAGNMVHWATDKAKEVAQSDNLSSEAKRNMAIAGGSLAAFLLGRAALKSPALYYRLGKRRGSGYNDQDGATTTSQVFAPASAESRALVNGSEPVNAVSDVCSLARDVYPVSNNFFAGAYALGQAYSDRKCRPSFGLLASDPRFTLKALRGLRAPKLTVRQGRIFRSSAVYAVSVLPSMRVAEAKNVLKSFPLAGGVFSVLASGALSGIKTGAAGVLSKLKEWAKAIIGKVKKWVQKLFAKHVNEPARDYAMATTPVMMAINFWKLLGKVSENQVSDMEAIMKADHNQLEAGPDEESCRPGALEKVANFLNEAERLRQQCGIPSEMPWNEPYEAKFANGSPLGYVYGQTDWKHRPELYDSTTLKVLRQYAPATTEHVRQLCGANANDLYDAFETKNPMLMFCDQSALESDVKSAMSEVDKEIDARQDASAATNPGSTVVADSGAAPGVVSISPAQGSNGQDLSQINSTGTDPIDLARSVSMRSTGNDLSMPRSWVAELPSDVQAAYYGTEAPIDDSPVVGDVLPNRRAYTSAEWLQGRQPTPGALIARGRQYRRSRMSTDPGAGFAILSTLVSTLLWWLIPALLQRVPWKKVGRWFSKNISKAKAILAAKGSRGARVAAAAKAGGATGAVAKAFKGILKYGGKFAKGILAFASKNPKLMAVTALVTAALAMGGAQSGDKKTKKGLLELLMSCLDDCVTAGALSEEAAEAHKQALQAMIQEGADDLTPEEAEELQTIAMTCIATASALLETGGNNALASYQGLAGLVELVNKSKKDAETELAGADGEDLVTLTADIISEYSDEAESMSTAVDTALPPAASGVNGGSTTPDEMAAIKSALLAAGASGGAASVAAERLAATEEQKEAVSNAAGSTGQAGTPSVETAEAASASLDSLTTNQQEELADLVDAYALTDAPNGPGADESLTDSVGQSVTNLLSKWGLPLALGSALTALVVTAIKTRRQASSTTNAEAGTDFLSSVSNWWKRVTASADPDYGAEDARDTFTGVVL